MSLNLSIPRFNFGYLDNLYYVDTAVGSGKTTAAIDYMLEPENIVKNFIYVAPSTKLCDQTAADIFKAIHTKKLSYRSINVIHSKNGVNTSGRLLNSLNEIQDNAGIIHIITTNTFIKTLYSMKNRNHQSVILDEAFDATSYIPFKSSNNLNLCTDLFTEEVDTRIKINEGMEEKVRKISAKNFDDDLNEYNNPDIISMCQFVVNPSIWCEYVDKDDEHNKTTLAAYTSPEHLFLFQEVVFLSAMFEQTILYRLWNYKFNITFNQHEYFECKNKYGDIRNTHIEQGKYIKIWYMLDKTDDVTRYNLERNTTTGMEKEVEHGKRVIDAINETVNNHFGNDEYLLVLNKWSEGIAEKYKHATAIRTKEHGSNSYIHHTNVAILASTNLKKDHAIWLANALNITVSELYNSLNLETAYQAFGRCAIRNRNNEDSIQLVVISYRMAELLHEIFPASTIIGQLGNLPNLKALKAANSNAKIGRPKKDDALRNNPEYLKHVKYIQRNDNKADLTNKQQQELTRRKQHVEDIRQALL